MVKDVYLKNAGEINSSKIEKANRLSHRKTMKIQSYPNFDVQILTFFTLSFVVAGIKATFFCRCWRRQNCWISAHCLSPSTLILLNGFWCFVSFCVGKSLLHDPNVLEAHPGAQWCADQDTEDHHDLLPAHTERSTQQSTSSLTSTSSSTCSPSCILRVVSILINTNIYQ